MKTPHSPLLLAALIFTLAGPSVSPAAGVDDWQTRRLLQPTAAERATERRGRVQIYDGMDESVVDTAMASQFGRIENMMFVRTRHTEPDGEVWEDSDCD